MFQRGRRTTKVFNQKDVLHSIVFQRISDRKKPHESIISMYVVAVAVAAEKTFNTPTKQSTNQKEMMKSSINIKYVCLQEFVKIGQGPMNLCRY